MIFGNFDANFCDLDIIVRLRQNIQMANILVIHGPNLNRLGLREPEVYGTKTLESINTELKQQGQHLGHQIHTFQSNVEGELINAIHKAADDKIDFILINPGAFTHTSIALRDALLAVKTPFIEIHLSNTKAREAFRHVSLITDIAVGLIMGFGADSYLLALEAAHRYLQRPKLGAKSGGHSQN